MAHSKGHQGIFFTYFFDDRPPKTFLKLYHIIKLFFLQAIVNKYGRWRENSGLVENIVHLEAEDAGVTAMGSGIIYLAYQTQCALCEMGLVKPEPEACCQRNKIFVNMLFTSQVLNSI